MSLIVMAVHDTEENGRSGFTERTLRSLNDTVDWRKHSLRIIDNGSSIKPVIIKKSDDSIIIIRLPENIGTARAINLGIRQRRPGEHVIKIDNDVVINEEGWVEKLEEVVARDPMIGQVGLKRKDCWETTWHENPNNRSELYMLPHELGQKWIIVEKVKHVIGTCVLHSSNLLDQIGYMYQPGLYGYDDTLMTCRAQVAGFKTVFLSHIDIDHIDPGGTDYIKWKERESGKYTAEVIQLMKEYVTGVRSTYYEFY